MTEYVAVIEHEGNRTLIDFPDCPGAMTFAERGDDVAAVAREALEGWLMVGLDDGDVPPRPKLRARDASHLPIRVAAPLAIALQIRWRRHELGWSQAELGRRLGVSRQQAASLENPDSNLRVSTLERAARVLNVELGIELVPAHV
jgi:DNA-binding XRE family transcriptional regulator/predicted RNase H-like HicB family nuclease